MPTSEGIFPKAGGDPVYYSEVNRFASSPQFISIGSFSTPLGSVLISGTNQTSNYCELSINTHINATNGSLCIFLSGLSNNGSVLFDTPFNLMIKATAMVGSPGSGFLFGLSTQFNADNTIQSSRANVLNDFNAGSPYVIMFSGAGTGTIFNYSIQAFRGTV